MQNYNSKSSIKKINFKSGEESLVGLMFDNGKNNPDIFFFHGGGRSSKERVSYLAEELLVKNISSFAFDFSGSGESSGLINDTSLFKRIEEAQAAVDLFDKKSTVNLCGSSMGAYIALSLLPYYSVNNLILFCPAVYAKNALKVNFGDGFSGIIRKKDSWKNTDAFDYLKNFTGNLLIFIGTEDEVIPEQVINLLDKNSNKCKKKEIVWISDCPHKMHQWVPEHKEIKEMVVSNILEFMRS